MTLREWIRALAFIPMAWMVATACVTRFSDPRMYLLYVIGPLAVGLHPLIEQRYYLPALTLFQIWRPSSGDRWENFTLLGYLVLVPIVTWGITYRRFFL
jgi:alpha-1,2-glucosyltransferase